MRNNIKKILKFRDQKDYKERVKKIFKQMYIDAHKKYEKNVCPNTQLPTLVRKNCTCRVAPLLYAYCRLTRSSSS